MSVTIRPATEADLSAMLAIYTPYVTNTAISFETEPPSEQEFARRFAVLHENFPWLCCEQSGQVVGYAYASPFGGRHAYDWSAETSVYIAGEYHGRGIGGGLYLAISTLMSAQGYRTLYARVVVPNEQSERFHTKCGFEQEAVLKNVGCKFGQWRNVAYYTKRLLPYTETPHRPLAFSLLAPGMVKTICGDASSL